MRLLATSATSELGRQAADALREGNELRLTDLPDRVSGEPGVTASELGHGEDTDELVRGLDAVIHIGYGGHDGDATTLIDYQTRCTYNLLAACVTAGVPRLIYLSTLRLLDGYETQLTVTERWRTLPTTAPEIPAADLGEYVCREFGRDEPINVMALRLGFPLAPGSRADAERSGQPAVLATQDFGEALRRALSADPSAGASRWDFDAPRQDRRHLQRRWLALHVQSPVPDARFMMDTAQSVIGYPAPAGEGTPQ